MKFAIHTRAGRVVSVTCEGHQWLFRFPEGSLGKEPTIAEAETREVRSLTIQSLKNKPGMKRSKKQ